MDKMHLQQLDTQGMDLDDTAWKKQTPPLTNYHTTADNDYSVATHIVHLWMQPLMSRRLPQTSPQPNTHFSQKNSESHTMSYYEDICIQMSPLYYVMGSSLYLDKTIHYTRASLQPWFPKPTYSNS